MISKTTLKILVLFSLSLVWSACGFGSSLPKDWRKALVSIELPNPPNPTNPTMPPYRQIGTGFFITTDTQAPFRGILITARHVFDGACAQGTEVLLRVEETPSIPDSAVQRVPLTICDKRVVGTTVVPTPRWVNHPHADLAAIAPQFAKLTLPLPSIAPFPASLVASASDLEKWHVAEGDDVLLLAFYPNAGADRPSSAIIREGVIAEFQEQPDTFLISLPVFPGNSGSPLVLRPTAIHASDNGATQLGEVNPPLLLGVVIESIQYQEAAMSLQTGRPRVLFEENSGLTRVVRAERIRELLALVPLPAVAPAHP